MYCLYKRRDPVTQFRYCFITRKNVVPEKMINDAGSKERIFMKGFVLDPLPVRPCFHDELWDRDDLSMPCDFSYFPEKIFVRDINSTQNIFLTCSSFLHGKNMTSYDVVQ